MVNQAMEFLVECRKAGGTTTEKKFLAFLSDFQHVSRCDLCLTLSFLNIQLVPILDYIYSRQYAPLVQPKINCMLFFCSRSLVKKQLTWFRSEQHSDVKQFHWIDASQPTVRGPLTDHSTVHRELHVSSGQECGLC